MKLKNGWFSLLSELRWLWRREEEVEGRNEGEEEELIGDKM